MIGYLLVENLQTVPLWISELVQVGRAENVDFLLKTTEEIFAMGFSGELLLKKPRFAVLLTKNDLAARFLEKLEIPVFNGRTRGLENKAALWIALTNEGISLPWFTVVSGDNPELLRKTARMIEYPCCVNWQDKTGIAENAAVLTKICSAEKQTVISEKTRGEKTVCFIAGNTVIGEGTEETKTMASAAASAVDLEIGTVILTVTERGPVVEAIGFDDEKIAWNGRIASAVTAYIKEKL